jgi:hypothetical protein
MANKKAAKPARGTKRTAATKAVKPQELTGARALSLLKPRLQAIAKKDLANPHADVGAAAIVAQGASKRSLSGELRGRFEKMASIGEFALGDLELFSLAALAAQEARQNADRALAKGTQAKVPLAVVKDAANVEHRMQSACEHTLQGIDAARAELLRLSPGTSYRDLADDLVGYAALYDQYPDEVKKDGVNFDVGDPKLARTLARKIYDALGGELTLRDQGTLDTLTRAWTFLLEIYERVATTGRFLLRDADPAAAFPSLFTAGRRGAGRAKKPAPAPAPEPPPPSPAPAPTAPAAPAPVVAASRPLPRGRRRARGR